MTTEAAERRGKVAPTLKRSPLNSLASCLEPLASYCSPDNWRDGRPIRPMSREQALALLAALERILSARVDLRGALGDAQERFSKDRREGGNGRIGASASLIALLRFGTDTGELPDGSLLPASILLAALASMEKGLALDPLLIPPHASSRRPDSLMDDMPKQIAAACIAIMLDDPHFCPNGKREEVAVNFVSRRLRAIGLEAGEHRLRSWRRSVRKALPKRFGKPGRPDREHLDPKAAPLCIQCFVGAWQDWRAQKGRVRAEVYVTRLLSALAPLTVSEKNK